MYSTTPLTSDSLLTMQSNHINGFGRAMDKSQMAGHLIDAITTTLSPLLSTNFELQEDSTTIPSIQMQNLASTTTLDLFHDLLKHMATSTDCAAVINAVLASFSVIIVSELGDKTFIITAIMAMKNSRSLVFLSSALALLMMTILSVGMGVAVTVIPKKYTHYGSIVLFLCFGLKMLKEAYDMRGAAEPDSEFEEVKKSLENEEEGIIKADGLVEKGEVSSDTTSLASKNMTNTITKTLYIAPIVIKVFTMIFVAEWGDRSQISTVILAAREDVVGVFIGSFSGHILCTGLAVVGGRFVAEIISVKTMTFLGGLIFLFFATFAIITGSE